MPRNPTYPLEALREHRERRVELVKAQLAEAIRRREAAALAKSAAEEEIRAAAARMTNLRSHELTRLESGGGRASDLAAVAAWEQAGAAETADRTRSLANAEQVLAAARADEDAARQSLASLSAELEVVVKDAAGFAERARLAAEIAEAESAEEAQIVKRRA